MASVEKTKEWIKENAPMLAVLYENKYVGMAYDQFASLHPRQQKQVILGSFGLALGVILLFLFTSYISLWSSSSRAQNSYAMVNLLLDYQKHRRDQGEQIANLERNNVLANAGEFKAHLIAQGRNAAISPRMMEVTEKDGAEEGGSSDVKLKQASVTLKKVNLNQLKSFLNYVEFGQYNLSISSLKITNDDKIRGYMNVDLGVVAYLFQSEGGGG